MWRTVLFVCFVFCAFSSAETNTIKCNIDTPVFKLFPECENAIQNTILLKNCDRWIDEALYYILFSIVTILSIVMYNDLQSVRADLRTCFSDIVHDHVSNTSPASPEKCHTASDFGERLKSYYYDVVRMECRLNFTINPENLLKLIEFSLKDGHFRELYSDVECLQRQEHRISACVNDTVGYFNITEKHKHSSWYRKIMLTYNKRTCDMAADVKTCTLDVLKACNQRTQKYVESLFNFSHKNCNNITSSADADKDGATSITPKHQLSTVIFMITSSVFMIMGLIL